MPFITEEIWQRINKFTAQKAVSIMLSTYPQVNHEFINNELEEEMAWVKEVIQSLRVIRSEMAISPAKLILLHVKNASPFYKTRFKHYHSTLMSLCKLTHIHFLEDNDPVPVSASAVIGDIELLIPMAGLINKEAELARLDKEITKLNKDITLAEGKLNNPKFTDKAPQDIIAKEKEKLEQAALTKDKLLQHRRKIEDL